MVQGDMFCTFCFYIFFENVFKMKHILNRQSCHSVEMLSPECGANALYPNSLRAEEIVATAPLTASFKR